MFTHIKIWIFLNRLHCFSFQLLFKNINKSTSSLVNGKQRQEHVLKNMT